MPQKSPKGTVRPPVLDAPTGCLHEDAVPVTLLLTGERVAQLCPACDAQLAADWIPAAVERLGMLALHAAVNPRLIGTERR